MTIKQCTVCGCSSSIEQGFIRQKKMIGKARVTCITCYNFIKNSKDYSGFRSQLYCLVIGLIIVISGVAEGYGWFFFNLTLFSLFYFFAIVIHELGHVLGAWLSGQKIISISFGRGKTLYSIRPYGVYIDFNTFPSEGLTIFTPTSDSFIRTRIMISVLFGPITNLWVAWMIWHFMDHNELLLSMLTQPAVFSVLCLTNAIMGCLNLIPFQVNTSIGALWSDGGKLLTTPFLSAKQVDEYRHSTFVGHAWSAHTHNDPDTVLRIANAGLKQYPDNLYLKNLRAITFLEQGDFNQARTVFTELSRVHTVTEYERAIYLNNIAYANYMSEAPELLEEALEYSETAFRLAPWELAVCSTRGAVLVQNGQLKEGIKLLEDQRYKLLPKHYLATTQCTLAIGYAKQGDWVLARQTYEEAKALDKDCSLLSRIEKLLPGQDK